MISSLRRLRSGATSFLALLKVLSHSAEVAGIARASKIRFRGAAEAGKGHRPCLQGLYTRGFVNAAFGVMVTYGRVAFGRGDSCGEGKG
jgi:hypothetical protein